MNEKEDPLGEAQNLAEAERIEDYAWRLLDPSREAPYQEALLLTLKKSSGSARSFRDLKYCLSHPDLRACPECGGLMKILATIV